MFIIINYNFHKLVITHIFLIILFTLLYLYLYNDIDRHYILDSTVVKDDFIKNKIINSLYLSTCIETSTGFAEYKLKSKEAKFISMIHMFLTLFVSIGYIILALKR